LHWQWLPHRPNDPNMIAIMSKHCIQDCYEALNARLRALIGYYDDINTWRTTPMNKMQMALQHIEAFLVPSLNLPCAKIGAKYHSLPYR
jgi:hypothetical protein